MSFKTGFMELCSKRGVTAREVCDSIGLNRTTPYCWGGKVKPSIKSLHKLSEYFDVPMRELQSMCYSDK